MKNFKVKLNDLRLKQLSKVSNAVLTPELNTCAFPLSSKKPVRATVFDENQSELKKHEIEERVIWCAEQNEYLKNFNSNAVIGDQS